SFYFHFRELVVGVDGVAESLSNPIRAEIRLPPPCEGRHARSCAPPSIGRPPYQRARRVSRFPHRTSSSVLLGVTVCASTGGEHEGPRARRPTILRRWALAGAPNGRRSTASRACSIAATKLATSGWLISSKAKFGVTVATVLRNPSVSDTIPSSP